MPHPADPIRKLRPQDLEIWTEAIAIGDILFNIADILENNRLHRFAEQLRGAGMSVSNNIAEGSGSSSRQEFERFLNLAKGSIFEVANIVVILHRRGVLDKTTIDGYLGRLDILCRKITNFQKSLMKGEKSYNHEG